MNSTHIATLQDSNHDLRGRLRLREVIIEHVAAHGWPFCPALSLAVDAVQVEMDALTESAGGLAQ